MFLRILKDSLLRQKRKKVMLFASVALGTSVVGAMLHLAIEIGDRIRRELKGYGANILVGPVGDTLPLRIGGLDLSDLRGGEYLEEQDLSRLDQIFWKNNLIGTAPLLPIIVSIHGEKATLVGTWFHHGRFDLRDVRPWWSVRGNLANDLDGAVIGTSLARRLSVKEGDAVEVHYEGKRRRLVIRGVLETGGAEDDQIFTQLPVVQSLAGLEGKVKNLLVSALTTPENDLYDRYQRHKGNLTPEELERYSCTPYITNIVGELNRTIRGSVAEPILQVARTEGKILKKVVLLMVLVAVAALIAASIAVTSGVTAMVMDRQREIGLLKALGAGNSGVIGLLLSEGLLVGIVAGATGHLLGGLFSRIIGMTVFNHPIGPKPVAAPLMILLACLMTVLGSLLPARRAIAIDPARILKGE